MVQFTPRLTFVKLLEKNAPQGIIVFSCVFKRTGAVSVLVDVHGVESGGILFADIGQSEDFGFHKDAAVRCAVKFYETA